jgi:hypothetical protein
VKRWLWLITAALLGCSETGQQRISVPLYVAGSDVTAGVETAGGVQVVVERAEIAFGPLYLCAGASAGDLCETARVEWLDSIVVDLTQPQPAPCGELAGTTGTVRSWMYDMGIGSQLTRTTPFVLSAAEALGDASFVMEGRALVDEVDLPFSVSIPIQQTDDTELGVPVVRKSSSDVFFRELVEGESGLTVRFDLAAWLRAVDFRTYVDRSQCTVGGPRIACDGTVEQTCEEDAVVESRDCAGLSQVCLPGSGCAETLVLDAESEAFRALRNALVSGRRPEFVWRTEE